MVVLGSAFPARILLGERSPAALADPISDKRAEAAQLAAQISALGTKIDNLSEQYDAAEHQVQQLSGQVALVGSQVTADQARVRKVQGRLRTEAVNAFISGGSGLSGGSGPDSESITEDVLQGHMDAAGMRSGFMASVAIMEQSTVDSLHLAQRALGAKEAELHLEEQATQAAMAQIARARQAAEGAVTQEQSLLSTVRGQLAELVAEQEQAQQAAAALATAASAGGYANPLRAVSGLVPKRIDQGVDYSGTGPLYAVGPGLITNLYNSGWPGGVFIAEELTAGPYAGQYWYSAEDIAPTAPVGEQVSASTVIGTLTGGADGVEIGWARPPGNGETMAMAAGEAATTGDAGSVSTAYGVAASNLLTSLGAPPGLLQ
jgi:hypothetical protein